MAIQVTAVFPDLSTAIRKAAAPAIARRAERYGQQMVSTVESLTGRFQSRPSNRRRYPGSQHITQGWSYKVAGDPTSYPIFVDLIATGDGAYLQRIHYLNDGTSGHTIRPSSRSWLRFPGSGRSGPFMYSKAVNHPGNRAYNFITATREIVVGSASARFG